MTKYMALCALLLLAAATDGLYRLPQLFDNHCMDHDPYGWYNHPFFNESQVATLTLEIPEDDIDPLLYSAKNPKYYPTQFSFASPSGASFQSPKVGIRARGFSSRTSCGAKHSFTVDLNHYHSSAPWGLHKIALRAEPFDPSVAREFLTMDVLRTMGVCHARKSYMRLEVNGEYWGLYVVKEVIGQEFLHSRFGLDEGAGMLYKLPGWGTTFQGQNFWFPAIQELIFDKTPLKTYPGSQDYASLIHLSNICKFVDDDTLFEQLAGLAVDVPLFLRTVASLQTVFDWDSLTGDGNNWYFALNTNVNQLQIIPTDFDMSIGMISQIMPMCNKVYNFSCVAQAPLYERVIATPAFRNLFTMYERTLLEKIMIGEDAPIFKRVDSVRALIKPYATAPFYNDSAAIFPPSTFIPSFTENSTMPLGNSSIEAVLPFFESFPPLLYSQLDSTTSPPVVAYMHNYVFLSSPKCPVVIEVHHSAPLASVSLGYALMVNNGPISIHSQPMTNNGTTSDTSSTWVSTVTIDPLEKSTYLFLAATVTDTTGATTTWPPNGSYRASIYIPNDDPDVRALELANANAHANRQNIRIF